MEEAGDSEETVGWMQRAKVSLSNFNDRCFRLPLDCQRGQNVGAMYLCSRTHLEVS